MPMRYAVPRLLRPHDERRRRFDFGLDGWHFGQRAEVYCVPHVWHRCGLARGMSRRPRDDDNRRQHDPQQDRAHDAAQNWHNIGSSAVQSIWLIGHVPPMEI
jgi:hypothetical protein